MKKILSFSSPFDWNNFYTSLMLCKQQMARECMVDGVYSDKKTDEISLEYLIKVSNVQSLSSLALKSTFTIPIRAFDGTIHDIQFPEDSIGTLNNPENWIALDQEAPLPEKTTVLQHLQDTGYPPLPETLEMIYDHKQASTMLIEQSAIKLTSLINAKYPPEKKVAICMEGWPGSGKSTIAKYLSQYLSSSKIYELDIDPGFKKSRKERVEGNLEGHSQYNYEAVASSISTDAPGIAIIDGVYSEKVIKHLDSDYAIVRIGAGIQNPSWRMVSKLSQKPYGALGNAIVFLYALRQEGPDSVEQTKISDFFVDGNTGSILKRIDGQF